MTHQATLAKIRFLVCGIKAGMSTRIPGPGPQPTVPPTPLLQYCEFEDHRGSFRVASQPIHGAIPLGYSLMQIREWRPVLFYTGTSCYATDLTLWALSSSLIALLRWKATGRYNLGSVSIVFTPPIIPVGLPTSWRDPDEKLRTQCSTFKLQACSSNQSSLWRWIWSQWLWLNWVLFCLEQAKFSQVLLYFVKNLCRKKKETDL